MNFRDFLKEELETDPEFRREWEESEPAAAIIRTLVGARSRLKWTQKELAERMGTTQANVSRAETTGEVSPEFLARFAAAAGGETRLSVKLPGVRRLTMTLAVPTVPPAARMARPPHTAERLRPAVVLRLVRPDASAFTARRAPMGRFVTAKELPSKRGVIQEQSEASGKHSAKAKA